MPREAQRQEALYRWRTTREAAARLGGVGDDQIYEWIHAGELTAFDASRKPGETRPEWRFKDEWLAEFESRRTKKAGHAA